jgi:hypothetical protein
MMHRSKVFQQLGCVLLLLAAGCAFAQPKPSEGLGDMGLSVHGYPSATPLQSAVDDFNARAQRDPIGRSQPPLTSAEVAAALRALGQNHSAIPHTQYTLLQSIANTSILPRGAYIRFIPRLIAVDGYDIDVWWIDLQLDLDKYPTDLADQPMHIYRIRTKFVSSRRH